MSTGQCVEIVLAVGVVIMPIAVLAERLFRKKGIGVRAIQFTGTAALLPAVVLLGLKGLMDGATIAALVGAFIGYVFPGMAEFDRNRSTND
jgi:hypothetical protein